MAINHTDSHAPPHHDQSWLPAVSMIPTDPGVYKFRDAHDRVIYVGKAKNLKNRLSSYFVDPHYLHPRTANMINTARGVEWTIVQTEVEALQLEYNWIKEYDPRFNVRFKDDKSYPFLQVTTTEEFPRMGVYRGTLRNKVRYFGPYSHAWAIRETMDLLATAFPIRTCSNSVFKRHGDLGRPCLLGYINKCSAPCVGRIDAEDYRILVNGVCGFLAGKNDDFLTTLNHRMQAAAAEEKYELAARIRNSIMALHKSLEKQNVVLGRDVNADLISLYVDNLDCSIEIFMVREGRVRGQRRFIVPRPLSAELYPTAGTIVDNASDYIAEFGYTAGLSEGQRNLQQKKLTEHVSHNAQASYNELSGILEDFILQYYPSLIEREHAMPHSSTTTTITTAMITSADSTAGFVDSELSVLNSQIETKIEVPAAASDWGQTSLSPIPKHIYVPMELDNKISLEELLSLERGSKVTLHVPYKGEKKALLDTVTLNAQQQLIRHNLQRIGDISARSAAINDLALNLQLSEAPLRIECIDISHLQGTNVVASLVVFEDGLPKKSQYRRYKIKYAAGDGHSDDVGSIAEVTRRRFLRLEEEEQSQEQKARFSYPPQLFIVDGGAPQVNAAYTVLEELELTHIPVIGIAKRLEQIWLPFQPYPIIFPRNSAALFLLQHIRDEAHRSAITFHRLQRGKTAIYSVLDDIPGIGPHRKKLLLKHFGSLKKLQAAAKTEIINIPGIGDQLGEIIYSHMHTADSRVTDEVNDNSVQFGVQ